MTEKELEARKPFVGQIVKRLWKRDDVKKIGERSDVFQLGLIALWKASQVAEQSGVDERKLDAYLRTAIVREILLQAKKAHHWDIDSIEGLGADVEVSESRTDSETSRAVREVLERLGPDDANVLRWRYGIDRPQMSIKQIGDALGISSSAAKVRVRAARERMRKVMRDEG